jgi:hypothetical protein
LVSARKRREGRRLVVVPVGGGRLSARRRETSLGVAAVSVRRGVEGVGVVG